MVARERALQRGDRRRVRVARSGDEREPWHPEQSITAREALAASTDGWGTVAVGHPADLVLLGSDPLAGESDRAHAEALRGFADHVRTVWVAGAVAHSTSGA